MGLNLQAADTIIMYDSDWNPQVGLQLCFGKSRVGQNRIYTPFMTISLEVPLTKIP